MTSSTISNTADIVWPDLGTLSATQQHILFRTLQPMQATGSCVWNGGSAIVHGWLNQKVPHDLTDFVETPQASLQRYAQSLGQTVPLAGMMTAASMNSLRYRIERGEIFHQPCALACIVTAGIQNARRAGDPCDDDHSHDTLTRHGTINIALVSNAVFSPAARIEALMVATEAKTAACFDLKVKSPVSGALATGTGTDSICLLNALEGKAVLEYCGKHTRMGEWIGRATYAAVREAVAACMELLAR